MEMRSLYHCDVKKKLHWKACQDLISRFPALCWHGADWNIWPWRQDDIFWLGTFTTTRAYEQFEVKTHSAVQQNEKSHIFCYHWVSQTDFLVLALRHRLHICSNTINFHSSDPESKPWHSHCEQVCLPCCQTCHVSNRSFIFCSKALLQNLI